MLGIVSEFDPACIVDVVANLAGELEAESDAEAPEPGHDVSSNASDSDDVSPPEPADIEATLLENLGLSLRPPGSSVYQGANKIGKLQFFAGCSGISVKAICHKCPTQHACLLRAMSP